MRTRSEDEARFRLAMNHHADAISRYCLRRLPRSDANDVVAEVFTVAWRKIGQMPDGAETLPWLYGVARNEVLKAQRRSGRWGRLRERLGREPRYPDLGPEPVVVRNAESEQLMKALATLKPADQEVLRLRSLEGLTLPETAVVLECSVEAAKKRSSRAMSRLRKAAGIPEPQGAESGSRVIEQGGES
jgi:RNA polymerase sigma-70 factor (ECF subfamily)